VSLFLSFLFSAIYHRLSRENRIIWYQWCNTDCFKAIHSRISTIWWNVHKDRGSWAQWMDDEKGVRCVKHGNRCTLKDLSVGQHHAWMIARSVGGLTKRGGATEGVLHSSSWLPHRRLAKTSFASVPRSPTGPRSYEWERSSLGKLKTIGESPSGLGDGLQTAQSSSTPPAKAWNRIPRRVLGASPSH